MDKLEKVELKHKDIVAPYDMHVQSADGVHGHFLKKGEPTKVNELIFNAALLKGCSIPGGVPGQEQLDTAVVEQLVNAMKLILATGDPDKLTGGGEPRQAELKAIVPNFTKEQRDEALQIVQDEEREEAVEPTLVED